MSLPTVSFAEMDADANSLVPVSLIVTVRDDRRGFAELLDAIAEQAELPDEIVVVDGGSTDGTLDELSARKRAPPSARVGGSRGEHRRRAQHRRA